MSEPIIATRFGDFLEIVGPDAEQASRILNVPLSKNRAGDPTAGIPMHSASLLLPTLAAVARRSVQMIADGHTYGDQLFEPEDV